MAKEVFAIETGLSSDPIMNRALSKLDRLSLISNSDAHSPQNFGREANVFEIDEQKFSFAEMMRVLRERDMVHFLYTIEFYPEEGKYHYDGHAVCKVCLSPAQTKKNNFLCPKCKKPVTVGVLHRVEDLADREEEKINPENFIAHKYIVPLKEIIAKVFGVGVASKKVAKEYEAMLKNLGSEFYILLKADTKEIADNVSDKNIALAIANMRSGKVKRIPGYDGVFGSVEVI